MNITAAVVDTEGGPFALQVIEMGDLRRDEVLVKIAASGVLGDEVAGVVPPEPELQLVRCLPILLMS
jgi:Zn-dependent alcohol dehydrogenase